MGSKFRSRSSLLLGIVALVGLSVCYLNADQARVKTSDSYQGEVLPALWRPVTEALAARVAALETAVFGCDEDAQTQVDPHARAVVGVHWDWECRGANGEIKWTESYDNLVVNTGLDDILTQYLKGSSYTAAHYVGLLSSTPTVAAADTMSSHSGWTEVTSYSESVRQTATWGTVASQSVSNSASKAVFSINGTVTVGGGFLTTNATKSGTSGTLVSGAAFTSGNKSVTSGDTLNVTVTFTSADDGI